MKKSDIMTFLVAISELLMIHFSQEGFASRFCPPRTMTVPQREVGDTVMCLYGEIYWPTISVQK